MCRQELDRRVAKAHGFLRPASEIDDEPKSLSSHLGYPSLEPVDGFRKLVTRGSAGKKAVSRRPSKVEAQGRRQPRALERAIKPWSLPSKEQVTKYFLGCLDLVSDAVHKFVRVASR